MQRIANLLAVQNDQVLLLQKPRRGWYVAPGGKMESGESIYEAAVREFQEETNTTPLDVHLKGVYTMVIKNGEQVVDEWMLYTFVAHGIEGTPFEETREGKGILSGHYKHFLWQRVIVQIYCLLPIKKAYSMVHSSTRKILN